jgi:hypothetical protein
MLRKVTTYFTLQTLHIFNFYRRTAQSNKELNLYRFHPSGFTGRRVDIEEGGVAAVHT